MGAWQNVHPGGIAVLGVKAPGSESLTLAPGRTWELGAGSGSANCEAETAVVGVGVPAHLVRTASPASWKGIVGFRLVLGREGMGLQIRSVSHPLSGMVGAQWHPPRDVPASLGVGWVGILWMLVAQA